jgi:urease accessory protein
MRVMMDARWLDALQMLDSSFPTGAYAHSSGLESFGRSLTAAELEAALTLRLSETLGRFELVFVHAAFEHDLMELAERFHTLLLVRESREASALIGRNLMKSVCDVVEDARLNAFLQEGRHHHHPVAFGAVAEALELPQALAAQAYAFGALRGSVSAAQRLGWLGQRDAQRVLHAMKPHVRAAASQASHIQLDDAGAFAPAWDIASMVHERSRMRLFAS